MRVPLMPIGASDGPMVAFSGFYESHEPLPWDNVHSIVPPHRDGHQNGQQSGYMLHHHCVDCCPGSLRDDTERVVARWRCPVVAGKALVMLHWAMCSILCRRTVMAIDMACATEVHLIATAAYFDCCNHS